MKWQAVLVLVAFSTASLVPRAESTKATQETQLHGYWLDPVTGLMWTGKDNGKDIRWSKATRYCRDLHLAGYSDWRLPTIDALQEIYDKNAEAPGVNPPSHWHGAEAMNYHVKGNLFLTGDPWSSSQRMDDRGHPSGLVWYFDFLNGRRNDEDSSLIWGYWKFKRALCVRGPTRS
jgi:hypothetical protein